MASAAQYTANRANAQHSTGPRTLEGKVRTGQNARKHGFTSQTLCVADEEKAAFHALRAGLLEDARPEGALEHEIFRRLVTHAWNLRRIESFESRILDETDPIADGDDSHSRLERSARYRRDLERSFYRALGELKKLQTQRAALLQQEDAVVDAIYSTAPLAEITRLTKQTDCFIQRRDPRDPASRAQAYSESRKASVARSAEICEAIDIVQEFQAKCAEVSKPAAAVNQPSGS